MNSSEQRSANAAAWLLLRGGALRDTGSAGGDRQGNGGWFRQHAAWPSLRTRAGSQSSASRRGGCKKRRPTMAATRKKTESSDPARIQGAAGSVSGAVVPTSGTVRGGMTHRRPIGQTRHCTTRGSVATATTMATRREAASTNSEPTRTLKSSAGRGGRAKRATSGLTRPWGRSFSDGPLGCKTAEAKQPRASAKAN